MKNKREKESKEVRRIKQSYSNKKVGISLTALAAAVAMFVILVQMEKTCWLNMKRVKFILLHIEFPKGK